MVQVVDIYTKVIIAVLSFIAPTVTLLLPVLGERINQLKSSLLKQEQILRQIKNSLTKDYQEALDKLPEPIKKDLRKSLSKYSDESVKDILKELNNVKKELKFLNLRIRIRYIFAHLAVSLIFVIAYHLVKVNLYGCFGLHNKWHLPLSLIFLLISVIVFSNAIFVLWKLVCIIIDLKQGDISIQGNTDEISEWNT